MGRNRVYRHELCLRDKYREKRNCEGQRNRDKRRGRQTDRKIRRN